MRKTFAVFVGWRHMLSFSAKQKPRQRIFFIFIEKYQDVEFLVRCRLLWRPSVNMYKFCDTDFDSFILIL